jgi:hypothetical protein
LTGFGGGCYHERVVTIAAAVRKSFPLVRADGGLVSLLSALASVELGSLLAERAGEYAVLEDAGLICGRQSCGGYVWAMTLRGTRVIATAGGALITLAFAELEARRLLECGRIS